MSAKHTPGPWEVKQRGKRFAVTAPHVGEDICLVKKWSPEADLADARLIAAAPDMLAGHVEIDQSAPADEPPATPTSRDADDAFNEGYARAMWDAALISRALVAKATGETP
jgi:hypothetical protein